LGQIRERFAGLTDREKEIMTLLARGRVSKQIAGQLGISEVTVRVHRSQIMQRMGARSLADLVRMADWLKADGGNALNPTAEDTYDGSPGARLADLEPQAARGMRLGAEISKHARRLAGRCGCGPAT
jgi:DNA-binding CsgD family transcriptional regulator